MRGVSWCCCVWAAVLYLLVHDASFELSERGLGQARPGRVNLNPTKKDSPTTEYHHHHHSHTPPPSHNAPIIPFLASPPPPPQPPPRKDGHHILRPHPPRRRPPRRRLQILPRTIVPQSRFYPQKAGESNAQECKVFRAQGGHGRGCWGRCCVSVCRFPMCSGE
jgi:hypothetical protein